MLLTSPTMKARINSRANFPLFMRHAAYLVNIANQCLSSKYSVFSFYIMVFINLILLCGDFEENPGPKTKPNDKHSVCHWNVNSIHSHNFQKIAVLESFVAMHKFDMICILNVNSSLQADHPSNAKRGGVVFITRKLYHLKWHKYRI